MSNIMYRKQCLLSEVAALAAEGVITPGELQSIAAVLSGRPACVEVPTPMGTIKATKGGDFNYPSIFVDFIPLNGYERPVAAVELNGLEDPDSSIRLISYARQGNCDEDIPPTAVSTIYTKKDLEELHSPKFTDEEKSIINRLCANGKYEVVGGDESGNALLRDKETGEHYSVSVKKREV